MRFFLKGLLMRLFFCLFTAFIWSTRSGCSLTTLETSVSLAAASILAVDPGSPSQEVIVRMREFLDSIPVDTPESELKPILEALDATSLYQDLAFFDDLFDHPIIIRLTFSNPAWLSYFTASPRLVCKMARLGCPVPFECVKLSLASDMFSHAATRLTADWIISDRTIALILFCPPISLEQETALFSSIPVQCFGMPQAVQVVLNHKRNVAVTLQRSREALALNMDRADSVLSAMPSELAEIIAENMSSLAFDHLSQHLSKNR